MGFSLLRWKKSGRDWSRGEPPPRGSVEYCGVPEVFQPDPRPASSSGCAASPTPPAAAARPLPAAPAPAEPVTPPAAGASPPAKRGSSVAWILGMAGVSYLGWRWLERRGRQPEQEDEGAGGGDVVVVEPGDVVHVAGDEEGGEVYSDGEPGEETEDGT